MVPFFLPFPTPFLHSTYNCHIIYIYILANTVIFFQIYIVYYLGNFRALVVSRIITEEDPLLSTSSRSKASTVA